MATEIATDVSTIALPSDVMVRLNEAARDAASEAHRRDVMAKACEEIDRIREKNRREFGSENAGVEIVRELRDSR